MYVWLIVAYVKCQSLQGDIKHAILRVSDGDNPLGICKKMCFDDLFQENLGEVLNTSFPFQSLAAKIIKKNMLL